MNYEAAMAMAGQGFLARRESWPKQTTVTGNGVGGFVLRGAPPPQVAASALQREDLEDMTNDVLRDLAHSTGVELEHGDNKAEMVNKILKAQRAAARAKVVGSFEPTDEDKAATDWSYE